MAEEKKEAPPIKRVLVVSAHPDDPEFGFGATVAKLVRDGAEVFYCVVSDGSQGGEDPHVADEELTATRYQEQRCAAAKLGVSDITFLGFRDGYLEASVELRKAITADIRRRKPDLVLTHAPVRVLVTQGIGGFHPDHLAVGEATLSAVYPDARNPRAYRELLAEGLEPHKVREVWLPSFTEADHFIEVTQELLDLKIEAIQCHQSQFQKPGMEDGAPAKWIRERAKAVGERAGFEYAEGFRRLETA